jgi:putative intracellular protease/amidase
MLKTLKILMVLTSHATMGDTGQPTGVWFEELSTPYYAFIDAGVEVDLASINGGPVPIDPGSQAPEGQNPASVERFLKDKAAMAKLQASTSVDTVTDTQYAAIFLPGGHGTMWDLPGSTALATLLSNAWTHGKVVAAVCHGPAGLVNVKNADGKPLVAGKRVSAFTNAEEDAAGKTDKVPFLLESRIRELGAKYESGPNFQPFAVRDGNLVTGQNPASSQKVAELTLEAVKSSAD